MDVFVTECSVRNPFRAVSLPLAARLYRYRKGINRRRSLAQQVFRVLTPSNLFLRGVLGIAGRDARGTFAYRLGSDERQISFRVANTQFHALYFPQYEGGYEPETTCLVDKILAANPRCTFLDVGANWGFYSLFAASSCGFSGSVHAFEPFPATFADLADVVRQAGLEAVIECHELALAAENRSGTMRFHDGVTSGTASVSSTCSGINMRMAALDSLDCPPPDLMKVDVEGYEPEVFAGAERTLRQSRPMIIFESWKRDDHSEESLRPFRMLARHGYRFYQPVLLDEHRNAPRTLQLTEFEPAERSQLSPHFNVFACHRSRCEEFFEQAGFERISCRSQSQRFKLAA